MTHPDTLLMLSGGIDSAWCLWQRVREGLPTRTHHVVLKDHEGRASVESRATLRILNWMDRNGGSGLIHHSESKVDFGSARWIPQNYYLWAYWAGALMGSPSGMYIRNLILPRHSDAFANGDVGAGRSDEAYKTIVGLIAKREPNLVFPMAHLSKAEVVQSMPAELLRITWHCRRPNSGRPCHKCQTCRQVDPALEARKEH